MASLPPEVLHMIAGLLDHRPSLLSFACVNRACYDATFSLLFQSLQFKVHRGKDVANAVNTITELLQRGNDFRCVRRLVVRGQIARINLKFDEQQFQKGNPFRARCIYQKNNAIWMPLALLIQKLPSLSDFIFDCPDPFATCLLEALRQGVPFCRLHLDNFYLRDPFGVAIASSESDEFRLLTSPCLFAIRFRYDLKNDARVGIDSIPQIDLDFHHKIAMVVVRSLAPGLREVTMKWSLYYGPSPRLNVIKEVRTPPPSLQRLSLVGNGALNLDAIRKWKTHTDLSVLRTLEIQTEDARDYRTFDWLSIDFQFPSLQKLILDLNPRYEKVRTGQNHVKRLLASLPPLSSLTLKGYGGELDFIGHHGPRLREFHLVSYLGYAATAAHVLFLRENCPILEELSLPVLRVGGISSEVAIYQFLGTFPKLRRLSLSLDPSCTLPIEPAHSPTSASPEFDNMPFCLSGGYAVCHYSQLIRNGSIRKMLENVALDATLAKAIYSVIFKSRRYQSLNPHLESLTLSINFYDWVEDMFRLDCTHFSGHVQSVFRYLTQPLRVEQNPRHDCHEPVVTNVNGPIQGVPKKLPAALQPIWDHIWGGLGTYNWRAEWASLPLEKELTES